MSSSDDQSAFPSGWPEASIEPTRGMNLRDWFAGHALQGLLAGQHRDNGYWNLNDLPAEAYRIASAMIEVKPKPNPTPKALTEQACTISKTSSTVTIECDDGDYANELVEWLFEQE